MALCFVNRKTLTQKYTGGWKKRKTTLNINFFTRINKTRINGCILTTASKKNSYHPKQNQDSAIPQASPTDRLMLDETRLG